MDSGKALGDQSIEALDLTLLSNFIHQVVNPLNGVAGTLDNLIEGKVEGEDRQRQRLNAARAQLEHCITLVRNLAFFAQGFSALEPTDTRSVIVPQVIIEAAMFFQEDAANRNIRIELDDRSTQNKLRGHPELIRQVLMNLFDNAVKYGKKDSIVAITQRYRQKTNDILISVNNESIIPIPQGEIEKIFDMSFRGSNAKKIVASGTGLGLYICKQIVENVHSGRIWVEASGSGQVTFYISLPRFE